MSGSSAEASKPYQGPQFGLQNDILSTYVLGNMLGANPWIADGLTLPTQRNGSPTPTTSGSRNGVISMGMTTRPLTPTSSGLPQGQQLSSNQNYYVPNYSQTGQSTPTSYTPNVVSVPNAAGKYYPAVQNQPVGVGGPAQQQQQSQLQNSNQPIPINRQTGFLNAGSPIAGQMGATTTVGGIPAPTTQNQSYNPYSFSNPNVNFTNRSPYQFSNVPSINVADTYTPQMEMARRDIIEQGDRSREQLLSDLNRRGMLTTGAANREMLLNMQEQDRKLADLSSQYSIEQGRAQLQEDQMRRQMDMERQIQQAAEIFRQQGATDEQAQYLATQNLNVQNAQAGQNLAAYNSNLTGQQQQFNQLLSGADLRTRQQGQSFDEALKGRQQATAEEQLANLFRRQPVEDLFKLWQQQSSPTGGTPGDPGIMPLLGTLGGAAIGALL
ncbi:MAG: hypothetical protein AB7O96_01065 [Pseudobdellovibrionaceae bacterium]